MTTHPMPDVTDQPCQANGFASVTLPEGMTPEEAERLVREADERSKENN